MNRVTIDIYNKNADVDIDGVKCLFDSAQHFIDETGFIFPDAKMVCYEDERNMFVVERIGGVLVTGNDLPEIQWIADNINNIKTIAQQINISREPVITWQETRKVRLYATDWLITRHIEQRETNSVLSLSEQQYQELLTYRQALRDMSGDSPSFPTCPAFAQLTP